jgi:hypothetical protein
MASMKSVDVVHGNIEEPVGPDKNHCRGIRGHKPSPQGIRYFRTRPKMVKAVSITRVVLSIGFSLNFKLNV